MCMGHGWRGFCAKLRSVIMDEVRFGEKALPAAPVPVWARGADRTGSAACLRPEAFSPADEVCLGL